MRLLVNWVSRKVRCNGCLWLDAVAVPFYAPKGWGGWDEVSRVARDCAGSERDAGQENGRRSQCD